MSFHVEVLSDEQRLLLPILGAFAKSNSFYLGVGTAVALYLGHRKSVDFDWFSGESFGDSLVLAEHLRQNGISFETGQTSRGTLHGLAENVRVSFFEYPYPRISEPVSWPEFSVEIASLDDLACMKLSAVAQRGSRKDFVDLFAISVEYKPLADLLELYRRKYSSQDIAHVLIGLTYFDDADEEPSPLLLRDMPWNSVKREFERWSKELAL